MRQRLSPGQETFLYILNPPHDLPDSENRQFIQRCEQLTAKEMHTREHCARLEQEISRRPEGPMQQEGQSPLESALQEREAVMLKQLEEARQVYFTPPLLLHPSSAGLPASSQTSTLFSSHASALFSSHTSALFPSHTSALVLVCVHAS